MNDKPRKLCILLTPNGNFVKFGSEKANHPYGPLQFKEREWYRIDKNGSTCRLTGLKKTFEDSFERIAKRVRKAKGEHA